MSLPDRELLELNELCQALIDGAISDADRARLEQRLAGSEEARRFYVRTLALSASLYDYAGEMQSEAPEPRPIPANERPARGLWWAVGSLAAAAMLVVGLWFGQHAARRGSEPVAFSEDSDPNENDEVVARLSGNKDGVWSGPALRAGEELRRGQHLHLVSGLAEIAFDSGAVVTLEGPASFEVTSAWEAVLHRGTLKAQVPKEAIGFRVSNPAVEVVDLGTEFSMVADEQGATEVFVLKGAVETRRGEGSQPLVMREREARRFARTGGSEVRDREQKWRKLARMAALDRTPQPLKFVHWTFDEVQRGTQAPAETFGYDAQSLAASLGSGGLVEGRFGRALRLDGEDWGQFNAIDLGQAGDFAMVPLQALDRDLVRTAAFWVKVPAEAALSESRPILVWHAPASHEVQIEISWNNQPARGPLGALQTKVGRGYNIGATSLRDGQWHHVAVVLTPGRKNSEKIQLKQYFDGRLDGISARRLGRRAERAERPVRSEDHLWIGLSSEPEPKDPSRFAYHHFRGAIDELFLANRALSPQEIHQLMTENRLSATPVVPEP